MSEEQVKPERRGNAGKGRKAGVPNKLTMTARETIQQCADLLATNGRTMYRWASKNDANEKTFWAHIYPKLLPLQVTGEGGGAVRIVLSSDDANL